MNKIFGFWHIANAGARNNWQLIYPSQWKALHASGLYAATDKLHVTLANSTPPEVPVEIGGTSLICDDPKVVMACYALREVYEFPALGWLRTLADGTEPFYAYYIHVKGASTADHENKNPAYWWKEYMEHYVVTRWRDCVARLDAGFDTCGVEWRDLPAPHYSGNFWWATSAYLKKLPPMAGYQAENPHDQIGRASCRERV